MKKWMRSVNAIASVRVTSAILGWKSKTFSALKTNNSTVSKKLANEIARVKLENNLPDILITTLYCIIFLFILSRLAENCKNLNSSSGEVRNSLAFELEEVDIKISNVSGIEREAESLFCVSHKFQPIYINAKWSQSTAFHILRK